MTYHSAARTGNSAIDLRESLVAPETSSTARFSHIGRIGRRIAVVGMLGFAVSAHADWSNHYGETGISEAGHFSNFGGDKAASEFDVTRFKKVNLGSIGSTLWIPNDDAADGSRDEGEAALQKQNLEIERLLGPIGGRNG